jgi:hypothetical protein
MNYSPSDGLIVASVNMFARKKKRHFFLDGLYFCKVFAKEMDMSLLSFLKVRGWLVVNKKGIISISYGRIGDCLRLLGVEQAANYYRISAMFDRLFNILHSRKIFPVMPFEQTPDKSPAKKKARLSNNSTEAGSCDANISDVLEGSESRSFELPNHGQVELLDFHRKSSAFAKCLTYQQTLQLAMTTVMTCIARMLPYQYSQDENFMEKLFSVIFFNCGERRQMLEGKPQTTSTDAILTTRTNNSLSLLFRHAGYSNVSKKRQVDPREEVPSTYLGQRATGEDHHVPCRKGQRQYTH